MEFPFVDCDVGTWRCNDFKPARCRRLVFSRRYNAWRLIQNVVYEFLVLNFVIIKENLVFFGIDFQRRVFLEFTPRLSRDYDKSARPPHFGLALSYCLWICQDAFCPYYVPFQLKSITKCRRKAPCFRNDDIIKLLTVKSIKEFEFERKHRLIQK